MDEKKVLSSLGLCARARKLIYGVPMVCEAMRAGKAPLLVLEAADTSENTHKKLNDKCTYYGVKICRLPTSGGTLAAALGKTSELAAVGITDAQMCRMVQSSLSDVTDTAGHSQA